MLAKSRVMKTDDIETITLFLNGVISPPESNKVRKLFNVQVFGRARGVE